MIQVLLITENTVKIYSMEYSKIITEQISKRENCNCILQSIVKINIKYNKNKCNKIIGISVYCVYKKIVIQ